MKYGKKHFSTSGECGPIFSWKILSIGTNHIFLSSEVGKNYLSSWEMWRFWEKFSKKKRFPSPCCCLGLFLYQNGKFGKEFSPQKNHSDWCQITSHGLRPLNLHWQRKEEKESNTNLFLCSQATNKCDAWNKQVS